MLKHSKLNGIFVSVGPIFFGSMSDFYMIHFTLPMAADSHELHCFSLLCILRQFKSFLFIFVDDIVFLFKYKSN